MHAAIRSRPTLLRVADYVSALISAASGLTGASLGVLGSLTVAGRTAQAARQREAEARLWHKAAEVYEQLLAEITCRCRVYDVPGRGRAGQGGFSVLRHDLRNEPEAESDDSSARFGHACHYTASS